jgi:predicted N-acyltransferase
MICIETRTIREMDEKRWDSVTGNTFWMTHRWLRLLETCWHPYDPRYLILENDQGAYVAIAANTAETFQNRGVMKWLYRHLNLVFSVPGSTRSGVMARPDISLESVMPELVVMMEQLCRKEKRLLMTISNVSTSDVPTWQQAGFLATAQEGVNVLDLPATYDLYLASLRPKDRSELRRIHKRAEDLDVHFEVGSLAEDGEQIYPLIKDVYMNHGVEVMHFAPQFFSEMEREIPQQQILIIKGFVGNKLSGVYWCLLDGSTLWWQLAGLDYEIARPSYLYFLLMDEMVRWSIEHKVQRIYGGLTNDREKQRHGFHLEERWFCYRTSVRPLNQILALAMPLARQLTQRPMKAGRI